MRTFIALCGSCLFAATASGQSWVQFSEQSPSRLIADPVLVLNDAEEKDYAWGDVDLDGDVDLIVVRKKPFTFPGGRRNVLLMNEGIAEGHAINGVLVDRTIEYASESINIPQGELDAAAALSPPQLADSQGLLDLTNDYDVQLADLNHDGWLDMITATGEANVNQFNQTYMLPRFLGHPRVYVNKGETNGVWQGFEYDHDRIPQLLSKAGVPCNPRFASVAVGDINGDGFVDLYFTDFDTGEVGPNEAVDFDMDCKLLINQGEKNPGCFTDETLPRLEAVFNYGGTAGQKNLAYATFGMAGAVADMNGDGLNDIIKHTSQTPPQHVATITNNPGDPGHFESIAYKVQNPLSPYSVTVGDLNNDGKMDLVTPDASADRYLLNTGNDASGNPSFTIHIVSFAVGGDDGFPGECVIADLNNDDWKDVLITDVDDDGFGCTRRLHIYHNLGNAPNVTLKEESPLVLSPNMTGTHDVAVFDINSDGWKDLVVGRCTSTWIWINVSPCPADNAPLGGNGTVDVDDLLNVINNWGGNIGPADITQNGAIDVDDLLAVINAWGPCE